MIASALEIASVSGQRGNCDPGRLCGLKVASLSLETTSAWNYSAGATLESMQFAINSLTAGSAATPNLAGSATRFIFGRRSPAARTFSDLLTDAWQVSQLEDQAALR